MEDINKKEFDAAFKAKLLETFKFTIKFLDDHNIRYYACGGTAIGAVRHKGIIPWDDDVDIWVPREDFEKLKDLRNELKDTKYDFISMHTDEEYYMPIAKIFDKTTSVWEGRVFPKMIGIYVDIFPIDRCDYSIEEVSALFSKYQRLRNNVECAYKRYSFREFIENIRDGYKGCIYFGIRSLFYPFRKRLKYRQQFLDNEKMFYSGNGRAYIAPTGAYGLKEYYKAEWIDGFYEVPFEDFSVKLPSGNHKILTHLYGDYMTPPPVSKQISHHGQHYVNLKEHISIEEAKKRINKGIHFEF